MDTQLKDRLFQSFQTTFQVEGTHYYFSPGRVNLIGEHTDYNGGKVFPIAITLGTYAVVSPREDQEIHAYSENFSELGILSFSLDELTYKATDKWSNYFKGMLLYIQEETGQTFPHGFNVYIYGTIPNGASLSSSASLEMLTGIISNNLYGYHIDGSRLAQLGMRVENEFLNLNSGIMDQFIIANGQKDHALLLDTNTLAFEQVPFVLKNHTLLIMNSLVKRELVTSEYNVRRQQCEEAVRILSSELDIKTLGELTQETFVQYQYLLTDDTILRRARHAVSENIRTDKAAVALKNNDLETFGQLMNESHLSLHDDYEVTVKETDLLVRLAWNQDGVIGARMTGGGFGGCCIAIVENQRVAQFTEAVKTGFANEIGFEPEIYIAESADGASKLS